MRAAFTMAPFPTILRGQSGHPVSSWRYKSLLRLVMKEKTHERAGDFQVLGGKVWFKFRPLPGSSL
jgi:hypothetical protein